MVGKRSNGKASQDSRLERAEHCRMRSNLWLVWHLLSAVTYKVTPLAKECLLSMVPTSEIFILTSDYTCYLITII